MNKTMNRQKQAPISVIKQTLDYTQDPTALFHALCEGKTDCLLLESAEIDSKQNLKSLLLIDAAVRITCIGHEVMFKALSDNGRHLIQVLTERDRKSV